MPEPKLSPEQQKAKDMMQRYRNVFGTPEGKIVLGDILSVAGFGGKPNPNDPAQVSWYNFAVEIARLAGAFDQIFQQLGMIVEKEK